MDPMTLLGAVYVAARPDVTPEWLAAAEEAIKEELQGITKADTCPRCGKFDVLDDEMEAGVRFLEPLCYKCREIELARSQMDSFDIAYERARANGWED
jgi:hypothetical protein